MSRATPQIRDFAERLIAYETRGNKSSGTKNPAVFSVYGKLRPVLSTLMGNTGVHSLVSRALAVTREEVDWLRAVQVKGDGSLGGLDEPEVQAGPKELAEGSVVLLAQLLGLLVAFIGAKLTLRLVGEVWPKLPLDGLDFNERNENKETRSNGRTQTA